MTTDRVDDVLDDLKGALDVEPSSAFVAGVRRRVEGVRAARPWMLRWRMVAAASMVAVVIVAVLLSHRPATSRHDVLSTVPPAVSSTASVDVPDLPSEAVPAPRAPKSVNVSARDSSVLIPPSEMVAMRALLRAIERGEFAVPQETALELDNEGRVKPLEIPLVVIEPLPTPKIGEEKGTGS